MQVSLRLPLVRLLAGFIAGIALAGLTGPATLFPLILIAALLAVTAGLFALLFSKDLAFSCRWIPGAIITLLYVFCGYILIVSSLPENDPLHPVHLAGPADAFAGRITQPPHPGKTSVKFTMTLISVRYQDQWKRSAGQVIVYGKKNTAFPDFAFGDTLLINNGLFPVPAPLNPGQFNYRKYLARQNISHQTYLTGDNFRLTGHMRSLGVKRAAFLAHRSLSAILLRPGLKDQERATAQALLLGDKSQLDDETYQAYSTSGTVHILCVSGLHVGVIYMILNFLIGFLPKKGAGKIMRFFLIMVLIWFYAFLTGLTPSVLRATVMFSILIIGKAVRRNTNIYNTLAASAFLLLASNPHMISDTGFQLSYLAVIGIVSLQPRLRALLTLKYWLPDRIWELLSVSIAAQVFTFPLTVHLFHQFPSYFLLANVLVVPLSGFIIYAGILVFATSPVPVLWDVMCTLFGLMIRSMNGIVNFIEGLPYSSLNSLPMDTAEMALMYAIILAVIFRALNAKREAVYCLLVFLAAFCIYNGYLLRNSLCQKQVVIYAIPGSTSAGFIDGRNGMFIMDSSLCHNPSRIKMQMRGHWVQSRLRTIRTLSLSDPMDCTETWIAGRKKGGLSVVRMDGRSFLLINDRFCMKQADSAVIRADYLLLTGNAAVTLKELDRVFDMRHVVADMSNSRWRIKRWKEEAVSLAIPFHDTAKQGAFIEKWE